MDPEALERFRNGWCLGSEAFRKECLEKMEDELIDNHPGRERLETAVAKAERLIAQELMRLNWTREDLTTKAKIDPLKLALAARLRRETTLTSSRSPAGSSQLRVALNRKEKELSIVRTDPNGAYEKSKSRVTRANLCSLA
ncbi:MAG TPA: hypothetical protein P5555_09980 [Candidatus Paceibacterota bacterium]|nr:hypothetical protein [Verrucomicrobiota bacterium]HRZ45506.1 hypothetical protein [Candidatus Paceibacterota bacterium]